MQFVLNFMRVSKSKSWKWWKWVAFAYNLGQVIFLFIIWDGGSRGLSSKEKDYKTIKRGVLSSPMTSAKNKSLILLG